MTRLGGSTTTTRALVLSLAIALWLPWPAAEEAAAAAQHKPIPVRSASAIGARFLASEVECSVTAEAAVEVDLDCDGRRSPNNEPHVVVDPADPLHVVVTSNDFNSNGDQFYVTFDGGRTWTTGNMSLEGPARIGSDPVTAIDPKSGNVIHASLNFLFGPDGADDGDIVVSISTDGGVTWGTPVVVGPGGSATTTTPGKSSTTRAGSWPIPARPRRSTAGRTWCGARSSRGSGGTRARR